MVAIFPTAAATLRLIEVVRTMQHDEWQVGRRSFSVESLAPLSPVEEGPVTLTLAAD